MIGLMIARDHFAARRVDRVQMGPMSKRRGHTFGKLSGLHLVVADGFAADRNADDGAGFLGGDVRRTGGRDKKDKKDGSDDGGQFHDGGTAMERTNWREAKEKRQALWACRFEECV
jgi:hypothetical protein